MKKVELALSCFKEGFNCAQAVFSAYGVELGIERETALKTASAFGGGMARMSRTCGAVTGAFMVIGLKFGTADAKDKKAKEKTYGLSREFTDKFISKNGSIECRELLGFDLGTKEGMKAVKEKKLHETLCAKFIMDAAEIIEEIL